MTQPPNEPPTGDDESPVYEHGRIQPIDIQLEMQRSYLDYAMSVIVSRALPDVRDGLKPVHRRVLYAMYDGGYRPDRGYNKCARVVGDVMGNYHPHGDSAIYDTLVRLAQPWALRYPLIDGQGNFGSPGNDPAAAMRYTECRMMPLAMEMVRDIDKNTVDFAPNYDGKTQEPTVLPARFPNLLVNGSAGIAVGMATNIPPHNLREADHRVVDRRVAVRVVLAEHVADDGRALAVRAPGHEVVLVRRVENAPVDRLEAVAGVGDRAPDDDAHRVVEVARTHLVGDRDGELLVGPWRARREVVVGRVAHGVWSGSDRT